MNRALIYLWLTLLRHRIVVSLRSMRRPTSLIPIIAVVGFLGFLFYFRQHKVMGQLVRTESLAGAGLIMVCGSLLKGFLQRGLVCELADIEFLFTSPFTQRQVVMYRLLPNYLFAVIQSLVFLCLFASHLKHPLTAAICVTFFQIACFHVSSAAAIFGGTISDEAHHRLRWMMLALFFFIAALYLRLAWNFRIVPPFFSAQWFQVLFYPAMNLSEVADNPAVHRWALPLLATQPVGSREFWRMMACLAGAVFAAVSTLWLLLRFRVNPFEAALNVTTANAEKRQRIQRGRRVLAAGERAQTSMALPKLEMFHGVGAIVWKNIIAVRRCRREMLVAAFFVLTYTGFFTALLWIFHDLARKVGGAPLAEARGFTTGIALCLGMLAFFLQRMFPFDFRQDGEHLVSFRTLPTSALAVTLAEVAVPTALCLIAQGCGLIPLIIWGKFDWPTLVFVALGYPAVSLALNSVWNLHYLAAATRRISGKAGSSTAVGTLMVVVLSFLVFYPAGWTTIKVANLFIGPYQTLAFTLSTAAGLTVQYGVDILLLLAMAQLFQRFEVARDS